MLGGERVTRKALQAELHALRAGVKGLRADVKDLRARERAGAEMVRDELGRIRHELDRGRDRRTYGGGDHRRLVKQAIGSGRTLLGPDRLYVLWQAAANAAVLPGAAVELGSYRGGSAWFLAATFRQRGDEAAELHVVDTFAGHPTGAGEHDRAEHTEGRFDDTSVAEVREFLAEFPGVVVHDAAFPDVVPDLPDGPYRLAHLDMDLYEPMLGALRHFGDRLVPGGVMVLDDFGAAKCPGVEQALREYLAETEPGRFHVFDPETEQVVLVRLGR